jgi:putative transposase
MPNKTFHYRIYLTKKQTTTLTSWLALLCETYNAALQERRDAYLLKVKQHPNYYDEEQRKHLTTQHALNFSHQSAELPACREVREDLAEVPSQVLQDVVKRVDLAFEGFFRRVAEGQKPGYPRFKSQFRYDSMTFKQYGNSFTLEVCEKKNRGTLMLAKVGQVKMVMHRPIKGTPKTAVVKRTPTGSGLSRLPVKMFPKQSCPSQRKRSESM